jgi:signal transduction histidine kinase/ActR/RegA family two-component response regulator
MQLASRRLWLAVVPVFLTVAALIALAALSMYVLSAVRAYVGGEGLWSKSQKDAIFYLVRYAQTADEIDFAKYQQAILVPKGDRLARETLDRPEQKIDYETARLGFLQGKNHPADIPGMSALFVYFRHVSYFETAIDIWTRADRLIESVTQAADQLHAEMQGARNAPRIAGLVSRLQTLNEELQPLEDAFSFTLGEASRWMRVVLTWTFALLGAILVSMTGRIYVGELRRRAAAEEALRHAGRRKDEFLATLSHELRNPLAPIRHGVEIMRLRGSLPEGFAHILDTVDRQTQHLIRLVDDLLDISRLTQGKVRLSREHVPVSRPIRDALEAVGPLARAAGQELTSEVPAEPLYIDADVVRITQVLINLLNNAVKFTPRDGQIRISARRDGEHVTICVRDSGIGIASEHLQSIFEMFLQVPSTIDRPQHKGLGIGLALARELVELHGGTIEARSAGPAAGSEFVVHLPLSSEVEPRPDERRADARVVDGRKDKRVLVVDDNVDGASSLRSLIEALGYDTREVHSGKQALMILDDFKPGLILLDIGMPDMNGYETAREIRKHAGCADITLVAVTGWGQIDDVRRSLEAGFDLHVTKPLDLQRLKSLLEAEVPAKAAAASSAI